MQAVSQYVRVLVVVLVAVLGASQARAQQPEPPSPLKLPATVAATLNVAVLVKAESTGKIHRWKADAGLVVVPPSLPTPGGKPGTNETWIVPIAKGRFKLTVTTATDTDFVDAETVVVVDGALPAPGPTPVPPGPVPPPLPPTPPAPPSDPLLAKLLASFFDDALPSNLKKIQLKSLVALYEAGAQLAQDPEILTGGELARRIKTIGDKMVPPGSLVALRKLLSAELAAALGDDPLTKLTPDQRERAVQMFIRVARLLSALA